MIILILNLFYLDLYIDCNYSNFLLNMNLNTFANFSIFLKYQLFDDYLSYYIKLFKKNKENNWKNNSIVNLLK